MGKLSLTDVADFKEIQDEICRRFPGSTVPGKMPAFQPRKLGSCIQEIDDFLDGGLPFNGITEFGMPLGKEGRILLLKFLVNATRGLQVKPTWTLWVSSHDDFSVFPPAWFAKEKGVKGIISLNGKFGQSLFRELSWATWWRQIETIENHLAQAKIKGYKQASFKRQCKRLQQAIPRVIRSLIFRIPGWLSRRWRLSWKVKLRVWKRITGQPAPPWVGIFPA